MHSIIKLSTPNTLMRAPPTWSLRPHNLLKTLLRMQSPSNPSIVRDYHTFSLCLVNILMVFFRHSEIFSHCTLPGLPLTLNDGQQILEYTRKIMPWRCCREREYTQVWSNKHDSHPRLCDCVFSPSSMVNFMLTDSPPNGPTLWGEFSTGIVALTILRLPSVDPWLSEHWFVQDMQKVSERLAKKATIGRFWHSTSSWTWHRETTSNVGGPARWLAESHVITWPKSVRLAASHVDDWPKWRCACLTWIWPILLIVSCHKFLRVFWGYPVAFWNRYFPA